MHGQAARLRIAAIARYVADVLGQHLTAVVTGPSDAKAVRKWTSGKRSPHPGAERNLRHAFHVVQLLMRGSRPRRCGPGSSG